MNWLRSWWSLWTTGRDLREEVAKATKADIDKDPIKARDLWAWAQTDPITAASYMKNMRPAAGINAHIELTMRLIAELPKKNDNRPRKAPRTPRALQPNPRIRRGRT